MRVKSSAKGGLPHRLEKANSGASQYSPFQLSSRSVAARALNWKKRRFDEKKEQIKLDEAREQFHESLVLYSKKIPDAVIAAWARLELAIASAVRKQKRNADKKRRAK